MNSINSIEALIASIQNTKNPTVVGLDPMLAKIPRCYKQDCNPAPEQTRARAADKGGNLPPQDSAQQDALQQVADVFLNFNKDIIDTLHEYIPAVKPQVAYYEQYGSYGVAALEKTMQYARNKGLLVIEDAKRNDIGSTAQAYARGHLGKVETLNGLQTNTFDADFLTVSPFLGSDGITPFIHESVANNKGIFVLVKTSNPSSGEVQDARAQNGQTVSECLAHSIATLSLPVIGASGYGPIGAVVGATYPSEAKKLRAIMPNSYFLVPGYGAQGGSAADVLPCFNPDGLGALVNSSRGILYSHMTDEQRDSCSKAEYLQSVLAATKTMQQELYGSLRAQCQSLSY
jgi:orotidine-5'-phosphate decarboxylase